MNALGFGEPVCCSLNSIVDGDIHVIVSIVVVCEILKNVDDRGRHYIGKSVIKLHIVAIALHSDDIAFTVETFSSRMSIDGSKFFGQLLQASTFSRQWSVISPR